MPATAIKQRTTPAPGSREEILENLGDLSGIEIAQNEVLLAIYQRPSKTAGGIELTHTTRKEDIYQGKVGLVVKIGSACNFTQENPYDGMKFSLDVKLHDWVVVRPSDTWPLDVNGNADGPLVENFVPCRLVRDKHIRLRISNPLVIW